MYYIRLLRNQQSRLKNRNYPTIQKFVDDVNAIFDNAMYYNEDQSQVWSDAKVLKVGLSLSLCSPVHSPYIATNRSVHTGAVRGIDERTST